MKDIRKLDLNLLKALDALLVERNVTHAAARLGVTQPAMSNMLARLREAFEDPLFARAKHGIVPTDRALKLAQPVKCVMSEIDALLKPPVFDPGEARQTFTLSATDYALRVIAVPFVAKLRRRAPFIRIALRTVDDATVHKQLELGEIDLALLTPESTLPDLHVRRLFEEHYVCAVREGHPAACEQRLSLEQFCSMEHALVSYRGGGFRGITDETLETLGMRRCVSLSVQSFLILPELLAATDMLAIAPSRLVAHVPGIVTFAPPVNIPGFTKLAVWHERAHHDPAQRWLRELLFSICSAAPDSETDAA